MTRPLAAFFCILIFAVLAGPADWRNWLLALPLAALLAATLAPPSADARLAGLPVHLLSGAWGVVRGTVRMLRLLLRRDPWARHGYVLQRPGARNATDLALRALAETASPGTTVAAADPRTGEMIVHDIDASGKPPAPKPPSPKTPTPARPDPTASTPTTPDPKTPDPKTAAPTPSDPKTAAPQPRPEDAP